MCKICGHPARHHRYANPMRCNECPGHICQDGPDGLTYRTTKTATTQANQDPP